MRRRAAVRRGDPLQGRFDRTQQYRLAVRTVLTVAVVVGFLVVTPGAGAGPPHGVCRHISKQQCERELGPYAAAQFLHRYVSKKLRPWLTGAAGESLYCGAKKHRPWVFRCGETVEGGGLPSPCKVEALVARNKRKVFRIAWLKESASCNA
jgi:hypothetical protein